MGHKFIDIVFDGPPSHESGRFVEVEDMAGKGIRAGEWVYREDGYWALRVEVATKPRCDNDSCGYCEHLHGDEE